VIEYTLTTKTLKDPFAVKVWIETKTNLPLKRVLSSQINGERASFTEIYSAMNLDGNVDPKKFELKE
jgi:hypothetical protein